MADKKISALNSASLPLAGTEVLPIVQSGSTVKVAVSNLSPIKAFTGVQSAAVSGTPYTILTTTQYSSYWVSAFLYNNGANFVATATFINDGTVLTRWNYASGAYFSLTVSDVNIQATQSAGGPNDIVYRIIAL